MKKLLSILAIGSSCLSVCFAGTYTIDSVSVTHTGGWPIYNTGPGPVAWDYSSSGGPVVGSTYIDAYYRLDSNLILSLGGSVAATLLTRFILDRDNITVTYTIQYVEAFPGDSPQSATGTVDTRYRLQSSNQIPDNGAWLEDWSSAGVITNAAPLSYGWIDCLAFWLNAGGTTVNYPGPSLSDWEPYLSQNVTFGGWTLVAPGIWTATADVPYAAATTEFDLKTEQRGASVLRRCIGSTYGEWQYRLRSVVVGGVTVASQPAF